MSRGKGLEHKKQPAPSCLKAIVNLQSGVDGVMAETSNAGPAMHEIPPRMPSPSFCSLEWKHLRWIEPRSIPRPHGTPPYVGDLGASKSNSNRSFSRFHT
ncbi:hypothetical protein M569_17683 [Genlisea aurea]|uniref:Uncharacterized protein n=1 Tax=Genlisea aurea TaxID=192259 RepID=S8BRV1_9LAMI|nr:hypothetical protein M569_17683 [Genlisea aurea]